MSTEIVLDTIEFLLTGYDQSRRVRRWVKELEIWCVPLVNPDGAYRFLHLCGTGRKNGRDTDGNGRIDPADGVDLNRNYPFRWNGLDGKGSSGDIGSGRYRGPAAGSEPETRAMMALAARERFVLAISYHTAGTKILVPYTIDGVKNPEPSVAWILGRHMAQLARSARVDRTYRAVRKLYSVDGVDQDWHYHTYGTLAYIIEGPRTNPPTKRTGRHVPGAPSRLGLAPSIASSRDPPWWATWWKPGRAAPSRPGSASGKSGSTRGKSGNPTP